MPDEVTLFGKGAVLGLTVSAPLGPIGVMCIRETLVRGRWAGFAVGMGAATADLLYATAAAFGLTAVSGALAPVVMPLRIGAGGILLWLAWRAFRTPGTFGEETPGTTGASFLTAFVLLISNPATIVIFGGVFVGLGLTAAGGAPVPGAVVVAGVMTGAVGWWAVLSGSVAALRTRMTARVLRAVNIVSGAALVGFAVVAWWGIW